MCTRLICTQTEQVWSVDVKKIGVAVSPISLLNYVASELSRRTNWSMSSFYGNDSVMATPEDRGCYSKSCDQNFAIATMLNKVMYF